VSFIDDHSKFVWIYLLRYKSEVFEKFHEFQQLVERKFDKKIAAIQIDWGVASMRNLIFFARLGYLI
jgi:hypothetical protein